MTENVIGLLPVHRQIRVMRLMETVLKLWMVAIFVAGCPATVAGRPATSPTTPRQSEVDGSVALLRPARTCPS